MTISNTKEVGYVTRSRDYLIHIEGLPSSKLNDIIEAPSGAVAQVSSLSDTTITALLLNHHLPIPGEQFSPAAHGIMIPKSEELLGRVINPIGVPMDNGPAFSGEKQQVTFEVVADGISKRKNIEKQFLTGITIIDSLLPIGQGQRQLYLGEPRSAKSVVLLNIILNQKDANPPVICIYAAIGKSEIDMRRFYEVMVEKEAHKYTVVIAAVSSETAPTITLTPSVALTVAESFRRMGKNVLVILDDMGAHAKYLREITLISDKIPGRELYPGDIFYQQAHLFERGGHFVTDDGKSTVSITILPVLETNRENYTNLIATNIMGSTDGHMLFSATDRSEGRYPPVIIHRSVTRLGRQTQVKLYQQLADRLHTLMAEYRHLSDYNRFGSDITNVTLMKGRILQELLQQKINSKTEQDVQAVLLTLVLTHYFDVKDVFFVRTFKDILTETIKTNKIFIEIRKNMLVMTLDNLIDTLSRTEYTSVLESACRTKNLNIEPLSVKVDPYLKAKSGTVPTTTSQKQTQPGAKPTSVQAPPPVLSPATNQPPIDENYDGSSRAEDEPDESDF